MFVAGVLTLGSYLLTKTFMRSGLGLLQKYNITRKNYLGNVIPAGAGIIPTAVSVTILSGYAVFYPDYSNLVVAILTVAGVAVITLIDDLYGEKQIKGFTGHFLALVQGHLTTGVLKAFGGLAIAAAAALAMQPTYQWLINIPLIALTTNAFNLLDLRPGRSIKVFVGIAGLLIVEGSVAKAIWLFPVLGGILAYAPYDLRGKAMLGDTGANVLGYVLGLSLLVVFDLQWQTVILLFLISLHIYAERYSLSRLIEKAPILNFLDRWGRPEN